MVTISPASHADLDELATVLADAFADDPPTLEILGAPREDTPARMRRMFRAMLAGGPIAAGTVDVAREDGRILGLAVWESPAVRRGSVLGLLAQLPDYLRAFGVTGLPRAARFQAHIESFRPTTPHWYLHAIGVRADQRGRGIGRMLLGHRLRSVDAAGDAAYLESANPRTGELYRAHGFETTRAITAWQPPRPYGMWRPALIADPAGA